MFSTIVDLMADAHEDMGDTQRYRHFDALVTRTLQLMRTGDISPVSPVSVMGHASHEALLLNVISALLSQMPPKGTLLADGVVSLLTDALARGVLPNTLVDTASQLCVQVGETDTSESGEEREWNLCPLSLGKFTFPVLASDGQTYNLDGFSSTCGIETQTTPSPVL